LILPKAAKRAEKALIFSKAAKISRPVVLAVFAHFNALAEAPRRPARPFSDPPHLGDLSHKSGDFMAARPG
jgi:hypothetical protein